MPGGLVRSQLAEPAPAPIAQRDGNIDVAKGLGIILVVFGHNWIVLHNIGALFRVIYSFHVPLFFFLSGIYFNEGHRLSRVVLSKADALLKPYAVVLLLFWVARPSAKVEPFINYLAGLLYGSGSTIAITALWFLPHLFVCFVFSWLLLRLTARARHARALRFGLVLLLLIAGTVILSHAPAWFPPNAYLQPPKQFLAERPLGAPFSLDVVCISAAYLLLGYLLSQQARQFRPHWAGVLLAAAIFISSHLVYDARLDLNMRVYGELFIATAQACCGIYLLLALACVLKRVEPLFRLLSYVGTGTLFILLFHSTLQGDFTSMLMRLSVPMYPASLLALLLAVVVPLGLYGGIQRLPRLSWLLLPHWRPTRAAVPLKPG